MPTETDTVPKPEAPPDRKSMPHALTFFLSAEQRRRVLHKLRRLGPDRASALCAALKIETA